MRFAYVSNAIGIVLRCIAPVVLIPALVAIYYHDYQSILPFVTASFASAALSLIIGKRSNNFESLNDIKKSEALLMVALSWVLFGIIAAIPYLFFKFHPLNALFEAVSGITTTGATILTSFDIPKTLFFWRSFSQWLGGMGIIVMFIAILPQFAVAGRQMFFAEAPGPKEEKITPRIKHTATALWGLYIAFTCIEIILLKLAGMPLFDSVCNSFSTLSGGGFSTNGQSIMGHNSLAITWIITVFLFIAASNFPLMYNVIKHRDLSLLFKNEEYKLYVGIYFTFAVIITALLYFNNSYLSFKAMTDGFFQVASIMATAGFASVDYSQWSPDAKMLLFILMFIGGSAGSAAGGLKIIRVLYIGKYLKNEISKILHPNAVFPIKINKTIFPQEVGQQIVAFIIFYFLIYILAAIAISAAEENISVGFVASITTLGNTGPGFGVIGPMGTFDVLTPVSKMVCIFNMLVGRLELIPFLAMLHPDFWRRK